MLNTMQPPLQRVSYNTDVNDVLSAARHAQDVANDPATCRECREEHQNLASWLYELAERRARDAERSREVYKGSF